MCWNPSVLGGIGISPNATRLFSDMHAYLASAGGWLCVGGEGGGGEGGQPSS